MTFEQNLKRLYYLKLSNELPQTWQLKITRIYYLTVSMAQESGHDLAGASVSRSLSSL